MREILFRGKRTDNGNWVEGFYVCLGGMLHYILTGKLNIDGNYIGFEKYEVDPKTVGQYTGLNDKNGKKIFEGDIVRTDGSAYVCVWSDCNFEFIFSNDKEDFGIAYASDIEVIGNIYDNGELLKGE